MRIVRVYHGGNDGAHRGRDRALVDAGADVTLVTPQRWADNTRDTEAGSEPFEVVRFPVDRPGDVNRHRYVDPGGIAELVRRVRPDVVDLHEEPFSRVVHQLVAVIQRDVPVVCYSAQNLDKRFPPPFTGWERTTFARVSGVYPCSRQAASVLRGRGYRGHVEVLPLGVDDELFRLGDQVHGSGDFRLALVGRMVPEKGVRDAIHALAEVRRHRSATLVLAGSGPELDQFERYCAEFGVTSGVEVRPWTGEADIAALYRSSHLVLVPSRSTNRWVEQFGRTVVEAQACGAVVVAYASGTIPEVAQGAAWLSAEGDNLGLARAAAGIAIDAARWAELRARGSTAAQDKTWRIVAQRQLAFYEAAIAAGPRAPVRPSVVTRAAATVEYGVSAATADGQTRPFALPALRDQPSLGRVAGAALDRVGQRRLPSTRS